MVRLHHFPLCPFSRKIRLVLGEKEIEALDLPVEPWAEPDRLAALNPAAEVPVLEDDEQRIADSAVIAEYLEETRPEPALISGTPAERAEIRRLVAWFDVKFVREVTEPLWGEKLLKRVRDRDTPHSVAVRAGLANVNAHLECIGYLFERRNWLAGDSLSLADLAAAAQLSVLDYLGDVPWDRHPEAKLWYARVKSRRSFRPLLADRLPCVKPADHYADLDF
ncbi:MAG: glutathione S-transferase family protein [Geminicoccaceae bacterium]|nr:glutathione S-transferase family protein [Geminicoccaceae bacterium]